jgi:hypothetical protein
MNLATLVSSLVLAASTATAGLLVAPPSFHAAPQDGPAAGPSVQVGPLCVGVCGNGTGNQTAPPPSGNQTRPPPQGNQTAPPPPTGNATASQTCGVDIRDGQNVVGPTGLSWSWAVGAGTKNLTVDLDASGAWMPLGGGVHAVLTDGRGHEVASADNSGTALPFGDTAIHYQGDASTGLPTGLWHLHVEADGALGSIYLTVHSAC